MPNGLVLPTQRAFDLITVANPYTRGSKLEVQETGLLRRRWLSKKALEIELSRPSGFQFTAGQTIRFLHHDIERYYSLISAPQDPTLALCVRYVEGGTFTPHLSSSPIGTRLKLTGPHGYFTFSASTRPPVFVATGTGIAPFVSMVRSGLKGFTLLHGVSLTEDLYYEALFHEKSIEYIQCISESIHAENQLPGRFQGRVSDYIQMQLPRIEYDFYLCGRDEMVRDVTLLVDDCFPGSRVFNEVFY
jgi:ferredoxin-NADP reductase